MSNTDLITQEQSGFLALTDFDLSEAMTEELAGLDEGFERIKIPSAGSTVFEVPGEAPGETDAVKEFSAVILYHHPLFSYYRDTYTGGNNPPDCCSYDGVQGEGNPGGSCAICPYNQFGSAAGGGKACKNRRRIYVLREGEIFPMLLSLPTGSLRDFGKYIKHLLGKGRKSCAVVTRFSLKKATNAGGIVYSQAQFTVERALTSEEVMLVCALAEKVKAHSRRVSAQSDSAPIVNPETGEILES